MKPPLFALLTLVALAVVQPVTAQQFESAQVIPPPPASGDHYHNLFFGSTVDAAGNWMAVADFAAQTAGEVYLYRFDGAHWRYRQTVTETDGWVFGWGMALDNKTLVVGDAFWGAPRKSLGRVHVYERRGQQWYPLQTINADGLASHISPGFGWDVAVSGDVMVIGAGNTNTFIEHAGLIRIYEKQNGLWEFVVEFRLRPSQDARNELTMGLGRAVAVDDDTIVAAAPKPNGAVFVWERRGGVWQFAAELESPAEDNGDTFGTSVDIDNDTIVVGAPAIGSSISGRQGEAYVYERVGGVWQHAGSLLASDGFSGAEHGDEFGMSVSVQGEKILVGAVRGDFNGQTSGTAYLYERTSSGWPLFENERLVAANSSGPEWLGGSSVLTPDSAIVGATGAMVRTARTGKVYVFDVP